MNNCSLNSVGVVVLQLAVIVFIVVLYVQSQKKQKQALTKLSTVVKGAVTTYSLMPAFSGEYQGFKLTIVLVPQRRNSPSYFKIFVTKNSSFRLSMTKESGLSRFGKKIGLVREVQVQDPGFDEEFLIFSDQPDQAKSYLSSPDHRYDIQEIFKDGFESLAIDGRQIIIQKPNYDLDHDLVPQNVLSVLERMIRLTLGLAG